jgi:hypothetical protein
VSDRLGKGLLVAASVLVSLVMAEIAARFLWLPPQKVSITRAADYGARMEAERQPIRVEVPTRPEEAGQHFFRLTVAGRRMRANAIADIDHHAVSGRSVEIRTNSLGYRNGEIGAKHDRRFLFLGDSITLAGYLDEEDTFVRRIEQIALADGSPWEAINAGVAGISLKTQLSILVETGLAVDPDVVIVNFHLNDFQESLGVIIHRLPAAIRVSRLLYRLFGRHYIEPFDVGRIMQTSSDVSVDETYGAVVGSPAAYMRIYQLEAKRIETWRTALRETAPDTPFFRLVDNRFHDWGGAFAPEAWDYMRPLFDELKRLSEEHGFELRIVCHPVFAQVEDSTLYDEPQRRLLAICSQLDIQCLDLLPVLRRAHATRRPALFYDNCHHTPEGSQIVAEHIYSFLRPVH